MQKYNLKALAIAAALTMSSSVGAQTATVEFDTQSGGVFNKPIAGFNCASNQKLDKVDVSWEAMAIDSFLPGSTIRGLGVENLAPDQSGIVESCNQVDKLALSLAQGPSGVGSSTSGSKVCLTKTLPKFDGQNDFAGTSGASLPNATKVETSGSESFTSASDLAAFSASGTTVRFEFAGRGSSSNTTTDAAAFNGLDANAKLSITYTCKTIACSIDPSIPADDPKCKACQFNPNILASDPRCKACDLDPTIPASDSRCVPCQFNADILAGDPNCKTCEFNSSLPADDPNCKAPPPVPGMTNFGLLVSLLGLPLIAGFLAARRRTVK